MSQMRLTNSTQEAFKDNVASSTKISQLVDEIATASQEQAHGIAQINRAVAEMDTAVQQAAFNAESSAAAAESMNADVNRLGKRMEALAGIIGADMHGSVLHASSAGKSFPAPAGRLVKKTTGKPVAHYTKALPVPAVLGKDVKRKAVAAAARAKHIRPEQVIPFDDRDEFKDF